MTVVSLRSNETLSSSIASHYVYATKDILIKKNKKPAATIITINYQASVHCLRPFLIPCISTSDYCAIVLNSATVGYLWLLFCYSGLLFYGYLKYFLVERDHIVGYVDLGRLLFESSYN